MAMQLARLSNKTLRGGFCIVKNIWYNETNAQARSA